MTQNPPRWAELILMAVVPLDRRASVSGDLLEGFREKAGSLAGPRLARRWYIRQVAGFAWRSVLPWTLLIVALFVGRNTLDALVPTHDFHVRATIATLVAATIWFTAGFLTAWRMRTVQSAAVTGALTAAVAPAVTISLTLIMVAGLVVTDNRDVLAAIDRAGGVGEMFVLPLLVFLPATTLAVLGGLAAAGIRRVAS